MSLRPATLSDSEWALSVRNDPSVRKASLNSARITLPTHRVWFKQHMHQMLILMIRGERAGTVRLSPRRNRSCWLHFSLASAYRGRGLGVRLVGLGLINAIAKGYDCVRAVVRQENVPSIRCLQRNGFHFTAQARAVLLYEWRM